jgi:hypothetical protein
MQHCAGVPKHPGDAASAKIIFCVSTFELGVALVLGIPRVPEREFETEIPAGQKAICDICMWRANLLQEKDVVARCGVG